jgi:hypothetical protein
MPSLAELAVWSLDDIRSEIIRMLPPGTSFRERREGRLLHGFFIKTLDPEAPPLWTDNQVDPRLLLLNAFGWLLSRSHKPTRPAWRPRSNTARPVVRPPIPQVSDPADLDPAHIRSVYEKGTTPKRK